MDTSIVTAVPTTALLHSNPPASSIDASTASPLLCSSLHPRSSAPNPRRLPLPSASQLPVGTGRGGFLGVTYRSNRENQPWLARYLNCTLGSYPSAYEAALARWVCSSYDRDVLERDGAWHGWAYEHRDCTLTIQRLKASTEDAVIHLIDEHHRIDRRPDVRPDGAEAGGCTKANAAAPHSALGDSAAPLLQLQTMPVDTPLPPANPRRGVLPTELQKTSGRGQYRGVTYDNRRYAARWKKHYLGSYDTAFEAGLTSHIAEHFDRDIEPDGTHGCKARAYRRLADGRSGGVEHFHTNTEAEAIRLVDAYHGIVRPQSLRDTTPGAPTSPTLLSLEDAIRQFVDDLWLRYSVRDGQAVCQELYKAWLLFLSRLGVSHLIRIKLKTWQGAVERVLGLKTICVPVYEDEQAMSLPVDCLVPRSRKAMFRMQWEMVMTTLCTPEVCVVVWEKRRQSVVRKSIHARQAANAEEVHSRAVLKERFPLWTDDWTPPPTLSGEELRQAAAVEAQALDLADLEHLAAREPDNSALRRELRLRKKGA